MSRELILSRMFEVLSAVDDINLVVRNQNTIEEYQRPGIILLDGDEEVDDSDAILGRGGLTVYKVTMSPQITILVKRTTLAEVGASLNLFWARVIHGLLTDEQLRLMTGLSQDKTGVRYEGCSTELGVGRTMEGEMNMAISVVYILNPNNLET